MNSINEAIEKAKTMNQSELQDAIKQLDGIIAILPENAEIQECKEALQAIMAERFPTPQGALVPVKWEGRVGDIRKGKPYFAILSNVEGKINYSFVSTIAYDSRKYNSGATAVFTGELPEGTIVRSRDGASWKNDYQVYSMVTIDSEYSSNLVEISELNAKRLLGIIK